MARPKFDIDFEEDILAACLADTEFLRTAAGVLDGHHFSTKHHAWIWKTARANWDNYKERTTGKLIAVRAKSDFPKDEDRDPHIELARKLLKKRKGSPKAALDVLELFARKTNAQIALEEAAGFLDKDDKDSVDKVYQIIHDVARRQNVTLCQSLPPGGNSSIISVACLKSR